MRIDKGWMPVVWGGNAILLRRQTEADKAEIARMKADGRLVMIDGIWRMRLSAAGVIHMFRCQQLEKAEQ
jgi:hypothetical protein